MTTDILDQFKSSAETALETGEALSADIEKCANALIATLEGIDTLRAGTYLFGGAHELLWRSLIVILLALGFAFTHTLNRGTRGPPSS